MWLHRWLGIVVGLLMLTWCLSGVVMLFVRYPSLDEAVRVRALAPIDLTACHRFDALADGKSVSAARIEMAPGRPILHVRPADGPAETVDLCTGQVVRAWSTKDARDIAARLPGGDSPGGVTAIERDQWTVTGQFNRHRPLLRVDLADRAGSQAYISSKTGEVVQLTTATQRFWNWLGAVPHWLYPTALRQNGALWTQVVIWSSLIGTFLTLAGLYLGVTAVRPGEPPLSPYRRAWLWHHLAGLIFGILTLTWVASGLVSMNPWGFLEGGDDEGPARMIGDPPEWRQARAAFEAFAASGRGGVASLAIQPSATGLRLIAQTAAGPVRLDAAARAAPVARAELDAAAARLAGKRAIASKGLIGRPDAYYFGHHDRPPLPVYRLVLKDGTRFYVDARTGALAGFRDRSSRGYRWLFEAPHRLDFLGDGPVWAALMLALLAGVTLGVATGVWLGAKRLWLDLRRLGRARR